MWTYVQVTGQLLDPTGKLLATGYSGAPEAKNDPSKQYIEDVGPIPVGKYDILAPVNTVTHGPYVLPLNPGPSNRMFDRMGFLIHGDSVIEPGTASKGCVIMPREAREAIWASGDHQMQVISGIIEQYTPSLDASDN